MYRNYRKVSFFLNITEIKMGSNHISDILVSHEYMTMEQQHQMHQHQINPNVNPENPRSPIDLQEGSSRPVRRASQRTTQVLYYKNK